MNSRDTEPSFIRRKFTITESLDDVLTGMAFQYYQGNVSLCIRAAIEDHRGTLAGDGEIAIQRLIPQVDSINSQQQMIIKLIEDLDSELEIIKEKTVATPDTDPEMSTHMQQICDELSKSERGLRLDDLVERLNIPASQVVSSMEDLLEQANIERTSDGKDRYCLAGYSDQFQSDKI
mgnify:FL=1